MRERERQFSCLSLLKLFITKFLIIKTPRTSSCEFLCIREKISSKNFGEQPCPNGEPLGHSVLRVEYGQFLRHR